MLFEDGGMEILLVQKPLPLSEPENLRGMRRLDEMLYQERLVPEEDRRVMW